MAPQTDPDNQLHNKEGLEHEHDDSCLEVINQSVVEEPGIVKISLDTDGDRVAIDYRPELIS
jgi:hypothetical protein